MRNYMMSVIYSVKRRKCRVSRETAAENRQRIGKAGRESGQGRPASASAMGVQKPRTGPACRALRQILDAFPSSRRALHDSRHVGQCMLLVIYRVKKGSANAGQPGEGGRKSRTHRRNRGTA